jgi:hypothetical protein
MKPALALSALLLSTASWAAEPKPYLVDHSLSSVIDKASAAAMLKEGIPARVWKLYPPGKWGFFSEVEGGFTPARTCVITARVTMIPLTPTMKAPLMRPQRMATAFDAVPNATQEQCKDLARDKLKEAIQAVVASLVKT